MMNKGFYFILKAFFVFSPDFLRHIGKPIGKKANVNFKIFDVTN